jgi:glycosyltransferase involved in cell wall biosynthesis
MTAPAGKRLLTVQPVADGGGSEKALIGLIRQLAGDGWECHVALPCPPRLAGEYEDASAVVHIVAMDRVTASGSTWRWLKYAAGWPVTVARLARLARRLDVDVVHSNSLHCWHGWAVAQLVGRPHVWHAREIVFQSQVALRLERWLARHLADVVIAASGAVARQLDAGNVTVVTDEADPRVFNPSRAGHFRQEIGVDDTAPLVGSVARLDTWKGFDVLLDAFQRLDQSGHTLDLVVAGGHVAGKEDYAQRLRDRAESIRAVHWLGPRHDVPNLMADLDVFVQVSIEPEPFGLVLVEALAAGVPVVAGAAGGPMEILGQAESPAGRLVPPGEPGALAEAVLALLPPGGSSTASRRARTPLRTPAAAGFPAVFNGVLRGRPGCLQRRHARNRVEGVPETNLEEPGPPFG